MTKSQTMHFVFDGPTSSIVHVVNYTSKWARTGPGRRHLRRTSQRNRKLAQKAVYLRQGPTKLVWEKVGGTWGRVQ